MHMAGTSASFAAIFVTMSGRDLAIFLVSAGSARTSNRQGAVVLHTAQLGGTPRLSASLSKSSVVFAKHGFSVSMYWEPLM